MCLYIYEVDSAYTTEIGSSISLCSEPTKRELLSTKSSLFVYPSRRLGISSTHEVRRISSALWAVSHHAPACISLRLDDIQCFALMIYRRQVANFIHGFAVILRVAFSPITGKYFKATWKSGFSLCFEDILKQEATTKKTYLTKYLVSLIYHMRIVIRC